VHLEPCRNHRRYWLSWPNPHKCFHRPLIHPEPPGGRWRVKPTTSQWVNRPDSPSSSSATKPPPASLYAPYSSSL